MKRAKQDKATKRSKTSGNAGQPMPRNEHTDEAAVARIAQADAEDAADEAWWEEFRKILRRVSSEHPGLHFFEVMGIAYKEFPQKPAGFHERHTQQCNRCGQRLEYHPDYDAHFCRRCNRWTESRCRGPQCEFCSCRPERPLP
jgi:hypothetical protein